MSQNFHITSLQQIFPYVLIVYKNLPQTLVLLKIILKLTHLTCVLKVKNFLQISLLGFCLQKIGEIFMLGELHFKCI